MKQITNHYMLLVGFLFWITLDTVSPQICPREWEDFEGFCYRFTRFPLKNWYDARQHCEDYNSDLVAVNTAKEHDFITGWLKKHDPMHLRWYTGGKKYWNNLWTWASDNTAITNVGSFFLTSDDATNGRYAAYSYETSRDRWGLQKVFPSELIAYICEISKERLHLIFIRERDIDYGIMIHDKMKIPRGPHFTKEPQPVTFSTSGREKVNDVVLESVADAYPPPTYKWYKEVIRDDTVYSDYIDPLSDPRYTQTDGTLMINNPEEERDRGQYHCRAENTYGVVISQSVSIKFTHMGTFDAQRSAERGQENWGKSISCDLPGNYTGVQYQWMMNKSFPDWAEDDHRIFASSDGYLHFSYLKREDANNYSCRVEGVVSSEYRVSPYFSFHVEPASGSQELVFAANFPKVSSGVLLARGDILLDGEDILLAGKDISLECFAYGYPAPSYNWTRTGRTDDLPEGSYTINYNRGLVLPKVRPEDSGEYHCTAKNGEELITKSVSLHIQAKPKFSIPLENIVPDKNTSILWLCEAFGIPDVQYSLFKNGLQVNQTWRENMLNIRKLAEEHTGMYQCKASNAVGSAISSGQLKLMTLKPSFDKYPMDNEIYVAEGGNIIIPCRPEAVPFPSFVWKKDNFVIRSLVRIRILLNGYLSISTAQRSDEGIYTCIARNKYGSDQAESRLRVLCRPRLLDPAPSTITSRVHESVELPCQVLASSSLERAHAWLQNGLPIQIKKHPRFMVGRLPGYLRIINVTQAEAGTYHCIVKTAIGQTTAVIELVVLSQPGAPGAVLAEDLTRTSGRIHWSDGSDNGNAIKAYTVEGRTNHDPRWVIIQEDIMRWKVLAATGRREVTVPNLSPWSNYSFRVSAENDFGYGEVSEPSPLYETHSDRPYVAPADLGGGGGQPGTLTITWGPLPPQEWNAPEIWYSVFYKPAESSSSFIELNLKEWGNTSRHTINLDEENDYRPYLAKVQPINSIGRGPYSEEVQVYSGENFPLVQPTNVYAVAYNSTALNVSWSPVDSDLEKIRGILVGYMIKYWEKDEAPETVSQLYLIKGFENWGLLPGLYPESEYYIAVMAHNGAGSGPESESVLAKTFKSAPRHPPSGVNVTAVDLTSVLVTWHAPSTSAAEEPILGYKVQYGGHLHQDPFSKEVIIYLDGDRLSALVCGLTANKYYKFRVLAFSRGGDGKMSSPYYFKTVDYYIPDASASYNTSSTTSVNLQWTPLPANTICEDILGYRITYEPNDRSGEKLEVILDDPSLTHYVVRNLHPFTHYSFSVFGFNPSGNSAAATIANISDEEGP